MSIIFDLFLNNILCSHYQYNCIITLFAALFLVFYSRQVGLVTTSYFVRPFTIMPLHFETQTQIASQPSSSI